jgi:hypothetical protein
VAVNPVDPQVGDARRVDPSVARRPTHPSPLHVDRVYAEGSAVGDAVDGAFAVLAVAASLVRYAAARSRRRLLPHLPFTEQGVALRRALHGPLGWALAHPASAAVRALAVAADELVPDVTRAVLARLDVPALVREFVDLDRLAALLDVDAVAAKLDLEAVLDRVDVNAVAAKLDLDAVLDRVDVNAIAAKLDLEAVLDRVDVNAIAAKLDLDAVAARLDLDTLVDKVDVSRVIDRVDLDAIVARVDLDRAVGRVDLDAVVARVDLDRAVDRVDVDRVIARTDLAGLARYVVQEIDLPGLLRASTGSVSSEMVRSVRDQGADADRAVERIVDRLLHRAARRTGTAGGGAETRPDGGT